MTAYFRTQGIVLQKQDIGEADRLFTVFTKDFGKLQLRAVSARKITSKLRGGLELFYYSEIGFAQGKVHKTITDTHIIETYSAIREDIARMRIVNRLAEVADEILKGEEQDERIWNLFQEILLFFNRLSIDATQRNLGAYYFLWNLLHMAGYGPLPRSLENRDKATALLVQQFLERNATALQHLAKNDINERLLKQISQEHLLRVLEN